MKKSSFVICLVVFSVLICDAQNIFDFNNTINFANYLYNKKNYPLAINEYNRAWFLKNLSNNSQKELFQSYLFSKNFSDGIELYKRKYPSLLAKNDTIEVIYGKLLISANLYDEVSWLTENSLSLTREQSLYLTLSADLLAGDWKVPIYIRAKLNDYKQLQGFNDIFRDIAQARYKSPLLSLSLSSVVPGLGKAYSGYWKDGLVSFLIVSVTAWQAYRGFEKYGSSRSYSWIFASLSTSFYIGNLYGSYKAANKKNYSLKHTIFNKIEDTYSKMFLF